jgi:hypothetical protein
MAYVRQHGGQLTIVSGERDKASGNVQQHTLFTFYSKDEALAAIGKAEDRYERLFQALMHRTYPAIKFDWEKIEQGIVEKLDILPDKYDKRSEDQSKEFEGALISFARKLVLADPYEVGSAKEILQSQKGMLLALRELIDKRISGADRASSESLHREDKYRWRYLLRGTEVPGGIEEWAEHLFENLQYDEARVIFELLVKSLNNYAEGHNYLGLIALAQRNPEDAVKHFEKTVALGRNLFPRKIAKKSYWNNLSTRPYMRGLMNLALALNAAGRYQEVFNICDKLERECGDDDTANAHRATAYLNLGQWESAAKDSGFIVAFALFELGKQQKSLEMFLHSALKSPHTARMLLQLSKPKPTNSIAVDDHNYGVHLQSQLNGYFKIRSLPSRKFFQELGKSSLFIDLLKKIDLHAERHMGRKQDEYPENFKEWHIMEERAFAIKHAKIISAAIQTSASAR